MIKPTIHLNGSSKQMLFDGWYNAYQKVREALNAIEAIPINARDYYPQGDDTWKMAVMEYTGICIEMNKIKTQLDEIVESLE